MSIISQLSWGKIKTKAEKFSHIHKDIDAGTGKQPVPII